MINIITYTLLAILSLFVIYIISRAVNELYIIHTINKEVKAHREEIKYLESLTRRKDGIEKQYIKDKLNIK